MKNRAVLALGHICVFAAGAITLALFLLPGTQHGGINSFEAAKFKDMIDGSAHRPYVSRALLPQTLRAISGITPDGLELGATTWVENHRRVRDAFARLGWTTDVAYQYLVAALLMYLCLAGFGYCCARLAQTAGEPQCARGESPYLAALAIYGLTPFFIYGSHLYDPPQILLFTASLYFLSRLAIARFLLLFALTTVNKETAILLVPAFAAFSRPLLPKRRYAWTVLALCAIYLGIRAALVGLFRGNPGSFLDLHLLDHSLVPATWAKIYARSGYFALLLTAALLLWSRRPRFLRIALLSTLPPLVIMALFVGYVDEWRGYYEAYPVVFALAVDFVRRVSRLQASAQT